MTMNRTHVRIRLGGMQGGLRPEPGRRQTLRKTQHDFLPPDGCRPSMQVVRAAARRRRGCGRYFEPVQALPTLVRLPRSTVTWLVAFTRPFASRQVRVQLSLVPVSIFGVGELNVTLPRLQSSGVFIT